MKSGNEGLMAEGPFVESVTKKTETEDSDCKSVTGSERVPIE